MALTSGEQGSLGSFLCIYLAASSSPGQVLRAFVKVL